MHQPPKNWQWEHKKEQKVENTHWPLENKNSVVNSKFAQSNSPTVGLDE